MRIYLKSLEPLENRYTSQWKFMPYEIKEYLEEKGKKVTILAYEDSFKRRDISNYYDEIEIVDVDGDNSTSKKIAEGGAFINFSDTNSWKSSQLIKFVNLINSNMIINEDKIIVADSWDPTILQLKYMFSLIRNLNNVKIIGIWHAGSYDKHDFLGRLIGPEKWVRNTERALFYSIDHNVFSTKFHLNIFSNLFLDESLNIGEIIENKNKFVENYLKTKKIILSGQPHNLMVKTLESLDLSQKENLIVFPHRLAPEKQPEIFYDLRNEFKDYTCIVCQEKFLTKKEYHDLLRKSKLVFSANLQETLGISVMEGILTNNVVVVPDRLSYSEMYLDYFKYPSEWTLNYEKYKENKQKLVEFIKNKLNSFNSEESRSKIEEQKKILKEKYLNAREIYSILV